jgi:Holliday junction resolvase RusA-like endonuclease
LVHLAKAMILVLPEPPSANRWWRRHGATMHLSREAVAYKELVAKQIGRTGAPLFEKSVMLSLVMTWRRSLKSGDLDKRLGILLDALQGNVYESDAQIVQIWARRCDEHPELEPGTVRVEVGPA